MSRIKKVLKLVLNERQLNQVRACKNLVSAVRRDRAVRQSVVKRRFNFGFCPICAREAVFVRTGEYLRASYICLSCHSVPRQRAVIRVLEMLFPNWREMAIHESSPGGPSSFKLKAEGKHYIPSHYFKDLSLGSYKGRVRCENLEKMTFENGSFDLVITQDVFEHVLNPALAFAEIARILKPGGAHVFTVPYFYWKKTLVRAVDTPEGIKYLEHPDYHGNPIDKKGSLVITEWGPELVDFIYTSSGLTTTIYNIHDVSMGLEAQFLDVFVSVKRDGIL